MLPTDIFLFSSASIGGGSYTIDIFFSPSSAAKYLRINDTIEDVVGNKYKVTTWSGFSADNSDGNTVTVLFLTSDVLPTDSTAIFDGSAFTPFQIDVNPNVHTDGSISAAGVFSGQNFEYTLTAAWNNSGEANKAVAGTTHIIDKNGKPFEITFIDAVNRFTVPFRAKEVHEEGIIPPDGFATLYDSTPNLDLFQGVNINKLAETAIRNRDTFLLDNIIDFAEIYTNVEGSTITVRQVVFESSTGNVELARADDPLGPGITVGLVLDPSILNSAVGNIIVKPGTKVSGFTGLTTGDPVFISRTTAGALQQDLSGFVAGEHVFCLGLALNTEELLFIPEYRVEL
jgi:hypothetical protein